MREGPDYLASFRLFMPFLGSSRRTLVASIIAAVIASGCELLPAFSVYRIAGACLEHRADRAFIMGWILAAAAGIVFSTLAMGTALGLSHIVAYDVIHRVRLALARQMARLPLGRVAALRSGDAKNIVIDEPETLEAIIAHGLPESIGAIAVWLAVTIWLTYLDWRMALAAIVMTPLSFGFLFRAMRYGGRNAPALRAAGTRMNGSIVEYLTGMATIKIFNQSGTQLGETCDAMRTYSGVQVSWARDYLLLGGAYTTLVQANIVVIFPVGLLMLRNGGIDLNTFLLFVILGATYSRPLVRLFQQFQSLAQISMGAMNARALLAEAAQVDNGRRVPLDRYDVTFEGVCFAYDDTRPVLHSVDFTAKEREITALVGASGSGKSTIASLIARFYDVSGGRVMIGGVDTREIAIEQLMEIVTFVFQDTFLFTDTVAANIRIGRPDCHDDEVEAAARAARAHDFITSLPQGYATKIGENGHALSGGERQRLAIARAILKQAPIVVLDEATAFADPDNEAAIQDAIHNLTRDRTLIVIAHRLHTIMHADQILVIDQGRVAESGRHDALIARKGRYASLWHDYTEARMPLSGLMPASDGAE